MAKPGKVIHKELIPLSLKAQTIFLAAISFIFYFNSLFNQYAFDDGIVIEKNEYVQMGLKGIPKILSSDAYSSFYQQMGAKKQELSGGRYRPLSIITFAIENSLSSDNSQSGNLKQHNGEKCWDKNNNKINDPEEDTNKNGVWDEMDCKNSGTFLRHLMNVLFYTLSVVCLFLLLRNYFFKNLNEGNSLAFLATLIFAIHPIHTEVVANVKSRDEILSFLFITLTFIQLFKYLDSKKTSNMVWALLCFFLALLSKEYAMTLLVLIPLSIYLFMEFTWKESFNKTFPFLVVFIIYMVIRIKAVGMEVIESQEILNNPYLFASPLQKMATELFILLKYFLLLIFPAHLTADYSYNQIPYKSFTDAEVWLSIGIHLSLLATGIILFKNRKWLAFPIFFYLLNLLLVSNLVFEIGATMGERLIYHSSFGFAIIMAFLLLKAAEFISMRIKIQQLILATLLLPAILFCGFKTVERNAAWKNDITLFTTDVKTSGNSILANGNAGARYLDMSELPENKNREKELIITAMGYLKKSLELHPKYVNGYFNLGLAYYKLGDYEKAEAEWKKAEFIFPNHPFLKSYYGALANTYLNKGYQEAQKGNLEFGIRQIEKACQIEPNNPENWYNLGGAYFTIKNFEKARGSWAKALVLNPDHEMAKKGMMALPEK